MNDDRASKAISTALHDRRFYDFSHAEKEDIVADAYREFITTVRRKPSTYVKNGYSLFFEIVRRQALKLLRSKMRRKNFTQKQTTSNEYIDDYVYDRIHLKEEISLVYRHFEEFVQEELIKHQKSVGQAICKLRILGESLSGISGTNRRIRQHLCEDDGSQELSESQIGDARKEIKRKWENYIERRVQKELK